MEVLIAILWYLQLIVGGGSYNYTEISTIANENEPIVLEIYNNETLKNDAVQQWDDAVTSGTSCGIIEEWEEEIPIPEPIFD